MNESAIHVNFVQKKNESNHLVWRDHAFRRMYATVIYETIPLAKGMNHRVLSEKRMNCMRETVDTLHMRVEMSCFLKFR